MQNEQLRLPHPPGLITSLAGGFESIANRIAVIALPVLFDLFLWFGPHLSAREIFRPWLAQMPDLYAEVMSAESITAVQELWGGILAQLNLFAVLRTFPVGISSLLSLEMPINTPLGVPIILQAGSVLGLIGWGLVAILCGWLIGALYYYWVSKITLHSESLRLGRSVGQVLFLCFIWLVLLFGLGFPALTVVALMTFINPILGQVGMFLAAMALLWVLVPVFFSAHGIFTFQMNALNAILNSLRMIRFTLPSSFLFLLLVIIIGQGLRFLWSTPPQDSWWMLLGILGHAFISTALLAASFIYYRDVNDWLKVVFEQLHKQSKPAVS